MEIIYVTRILFIFVALALLMMGINFIRMGKFYSNRPVLYCGIALICASLTSLLLFMVPSGNTFYFGVSLFLVLVTYIDHLYREKKINDFLLQKNIGKAKLLSPLLRLD